MKSRPCVLAMLLCASPTVSAEENASNPLAKSRNTDVRWQHLDLVDGSRLNDFFIDGSFMATDKLKIKYELHYWETNLSGRGESGLECLHPAVLDRPRTAPT